MMKISKKTDSNFSADMFLSKIFTKGGPVLLFGTIVAFFSTIFGYTNFGSLLNSAVLSSLMIGLLLGLAFLCIITLIYFFIQTSYAEKSLIVKEKKKNLFNWLRKILRLTAILLWIYYTLRLIYLWRPVSIALESFWKAGFQFGNFNLTLGGVVSFMLIIYLSWLVSYIIRLLLEVEIFGRFDMPRGVPMAISSLTQYFLIFLGFMLAMSKLGFDLKNLSLLAGALGVGIGFGLQNTVNNFISGLILVFERPVTVGDIVNVAGHEGEVTKIGIRSSTIKQWDGSEVIVPNADLISQKVVNWTLTKYTRRIILTIHTHLDTDPDQVLGLMSEAAAKVKYVLKDPEAKAYFHGMKDKHLEFALFYWASGNILDCKSQVNLEVQKSLKAAGIKFQMPIPLKIDESKPPTQKS
jgi:small-conductance mechanosensitive channel